MYWNPVKTPLYVMFFNVYLFLHHLLRVFREKNHPVQFRIITVWLWRLFDFSEAYVQRSWHIQANDIGFVNSVYPSSFDSLFWLFLHLIFYYPYYCTPISFFSKTIGLWSVFLFSCCYSAPINFILIIFNPCCLMGEYTKRPPDSSVVYGATSCGLGVMASDFT